MPAWTFSLVFLRAGYLIVHQNRQIAAEWCVARVSDPLFGVCVCVRARVALLTSDSQRPSLKCSRAWTASDAEYLSFEGMVMQSHAGCRRSNAPRFAEHRTKVRHLFASMKPQNAALGLKGGPDSSINARSGGLFVL